MDAFYPGVHSLSDWISCLLLGKVWNVLGDRRRSKKIDFDIKSTFGPKGPLSSCDDEVQVERRWLRKKLYSDGRVRAVTGQG